jgi:hypothetical protein
MSFSLILTHPGGSHKDEFLACCVLLAHDPSPIVRREPTTDDLADPTIAWYILGIEATVLALMLFICNRLLRHPTPCT